MHDQNEAVRIYFLKKDPTRVDDPEAVELAYWLQNSSPNDPSVLERLVYRYANELYTWAEILLYYRKEEVPSHAEILSSLKIVFGTAIKNVEQFHGKESVSDWLFAIAYQVIRGLKAKTERKINIQELQEGLDREASFQDVDYTNEDNLEYLPERVRSTLILRYRYELELLAIANILNISPNEVHQRLIKGRKQLIKDPVRSHLQLKIQAFMDGLLDADPAELESFNCHLDGCKVCQQSLEKIDVLEQNLVEILRKRWVSPSLSNEILNSLIQSVIDDSVKPKASPVDDWIRYHIHSINSRRKEYCPTRDNTCSSTPSYRWNAASRGIIPGYK
jgi:RNA polymerase sigma factor (sigma-70 family)